MGGRTPHTPAAATTSLCCFQNCGAGGGGGGGGAWMNCCTASGEGIHKHTAAHAEAASSRRGAHLTQCGTPTCLLQLATSCPVTTFQACMLRSATQPAAVGAGHTAQRMSPAATRARATRAHAIKDMMRRKPWHSCSALAGSCCVEGAGAPRHGAHSPNTASKL
jgi:hypothetical protein